MPFPIDEKYIKQAEQQIGFIFPVSFKSKMQQLNGGEVIADDDQWQLFPFFDQADKKHIKRTCNHILYETKQAQHWIGFPAHAIAIASNGAGDLLILQKDDHSHHLQETIYRWLHETGESKVIAKCFDQLKLV